MNTPYLHLHIARQCLASHCISLNCHSGGGEILPQLKNREFEGGLEKRKGKGGKEENKERVIKHTLKYLYEA